MRLNHKSPPSSGVSSPVMGLLSVRARMPWGIELTFAQMALVTGIVFYSLAMPGDLRYKLNAMGFGVCHQIDSHSYTIGDHQMPLCARCSGIYLGALACVGMLSALRRRSMRLPTWPTLAILLTFFGAMVADGINSTVQTFGPGVWTSTNPLRLFTGALAGIAIAFVFYPLFNLTLWHPDTARRDSVLEQPFELIGYLVVAGVLVTLVLDGGDWLYYPLALLSIIGILTLLAMANTMLVLIVSKHEGLARSFSDALTPLLFAVLLSLVELTLLVWGRASLAPLLVNNIGMPLEPGLP